MTQKRRNRVYRGKVSAQFASRLEHLEPQNRVRAILVLDTKGSGDMTGQPPSRAERHVAINEMRRLTEEAVAEVDEALARSGGRRLAGPDALGSVSVETTTGGIYELAASEHVRAILEDQAVSPLPQSGRS